MTVIFSLQAKKQLDRLQAHQALKVTRQLRLLNSNPFIGKLLGGNLKDFRSLRAWPYRIVYRVDKQKKLVLIHTIEHRQGVYK